MKLDFPFISYTVSEGRGDFVLRSTEIEIPEIGSREFEGGTTLIDHVHYVGEGSHWFVPRLNEINSRKPWKGLLPTFEGDQSGSDDPDRQRAFLMRKLSEHIFGARMVDFDTIASAEGFNSHVAGAWLVRRNPVHSSLSRGGRKASLDMTETTAARIKAYALRNMRSVEGKVIIRGHDPIIGIGIDNHLGNHAVLTVEDGVLWGTPSRSQWNFSIEELDEALAFKERIHVHPDKDKRIWKGLDEPTSSIRDKISRLGDLDLPEDTFEKTLAATVPKCVYGKDWLAIPAETKFSAARISASLGTQPEDRDSSFYDGIAAYLGDLPADTPLTHAMVHWTLERWEQREVALAIPPLSPRL